jgi:CHAT domain-containing protein/tetratricopeptide (TPR) repeat protein
MLKLLWIQPIAIVLFSLPLLSTLPLPTLAAPATRTTSQSQLLTIYYPLQRIQWEGQYRTRHGFSYFGVSELTPAYVAEVELDVARQRRDRKLEATVQAKLGLRYLTMDLFDQSLAAYWESFRLAKAEGDRKLEGIALASLGLVRAQKGFFDAETLNYLSDYWQWTRQQGDRKAEEIALGNLGNAYFGSDLYLKAIEFHQKRLTLAKQLKNRAGEAKAYGDLGLVYQALGELQKALELHQQHLAIAQQIGDLIGQQISLGNIGIVHHTLEDYTTAIEFQQKRLTLAKQLNDLSAEAEAIANIAGAYYFQGKYDRAIALYDQAWNIAWTKLHDADILYGLRGNQGLAYFQTGRMEEAQEMFRQHLIYLRSRKSLRGQGGVKNNLAAIQFQAGKLPTADKTLREGIELWESLRQRLGDHDAYKVSIFETQNVPYINLQSLLVQQKQPEAALELAERGRARAFAELLTRRLAPAQTATAPGAKFSTSPTQTRPSRSTPAQRSLAQPPLAPPNLAKIQHIAKTSQATLVEYSILSEGLKGADGVRSEETKLLIWVIKPNGEVILRQTDLATTWQQEIRSLGELVVNSRAAIGVRGSHRGSRPVTSRQFADLSFHQLHRLLIQPIADLLPKNPDDLVVFIPQDALFLVPFASLQDANGQYLVEHHTIAIAPSIQVLELTQQQRQRLAPRSDNPSRFSQALIVGNPTMPTVLTAPGEPPESLAPLPGSEKEAIAIGQLLNRPVLTGNQATETMILRQMPQASIIHLATHGLLDDIGRQGVPGSLALAPSDSHDGLLTANEILNLKLNAELVVLSACDTGRGRITGDGVVGLSRSFIAAGVPSVVVSLWAVPDAPTAALMTEFYRQLQTESNKAKALRKAMLVTAKQFPNPRDWAAFILIGEAR